MRRLDGNSILVIEDDRAYRDELCGLFNKTGAQVFSVGSFADTIKSLEIQDFDVVLCAYYLPDGLIHSVIDWCRSHLEYLPVFISLGTGMPADENLLRRHLISCVFSREDDHDKIIRSVQNFLFDFNKFCESLLSFVEDKGINLELVVNEETTQVSPIEIIDEGVFMSTSQRYDVGTFGLLRIILFEDEVIESFTMIGSLGGKTQGGQLFKINESYGAAWVRLRERLELRQTNISGFLRKVAGR